MVKHKNLKTVANVNRSSEEYAQSVFEEMYKDETLRTSCAKLLANSIEIANQAGPSSWSLTLYPDRIRLNTGPVEVLVLSSHEIFLIIIDSEEGHYDDRRYDNLVTSPDIYYRSVPVNHRLCYLLPEEITELYPLIADDHHKFIQIAAGRRKKTAWKYSFSPGVIRYLNNLIGISLPMPSYFSDSTVNPPLFLSQFATEETVLEGAVPKALANVSERNPEARRIGIKHYVQYHNSEVMGDPCDEFDDLDIGYFGIVTNKSVQKLQGNKIWLICGEGKPREYFLCQFFIVDEVRKTNDNSDFKYYVTGKEGISLRPPIPLNPLPWFKDFREYMGNFGFGLMKIEQKYVEKLEKLVCEEAQTIKLLQKNSVGFGSPETNRKVEQAAITFVTKHYESNGWSVQSVEIAKKGYDLLCVKGSIEEHVEVKGLQSEVIRFIITAGEVQCAHRDERFVLCVVTSAISIHPQLFRYTANEFVRQFDLSPAVFHASLHT
jgi:hypothetical protein